MNYRIDPRSPKGGADLIMAIATAKTGDSITILLPASLQDNATKLVSSVSNQLRHGGIFLGGRVVTVNHEIIDL